MTARFRQEDIDRMMRHLRIAGAPFGITFADRPFLSNSRPALQAAEYARDQGRFQELHTALFAAYFSLGLDIGSLDILGQLAGDAGLDPAGMKKAIQDGAYLQRLEQARQEAGLREVTGVPTFYLADRKSIVGAQPLDVFRKALRSL
jgi:predicted DsbA family dithiol-disulfide isomerase